MVKDINMKQKLLKIISVVLITGGIVLLLYPLFTDLYSMAYQWIQLHSIESKMDKQTDTIAQNDTSDVQNNSTENPVVEIPPTEEVIPQELKQAVLEIPALNLKAVVLKGTSQTALAKGPGWYEQSSLPGQGNTAIAAHRTMYGGWFRNLDKLKEGDEIILIYQDQTLVYKVEYTRIIDNNDWSMISPTGYSALTLTTCGYHDSSVRLTVRARQVKTNRQ